MTADQTVERAATKLQQLANQWAGESGLKAKLAQPLAEDADLIRKMKPSLIKARAKGKETVNQVPEREAPAPSAPQAARPRRQRKAKRPRRRQGPNPFVVAGIALAAGIGLAKLIDWRGHPHPRN